MKSNDKKISLSQYNFSSRYLDISVVKKEIHTRCLNYDDLMNLMFRNANIIHINSVNMQ